MSGAQNHKDKLTLSYISNSNILELPDTLLHDALEPFGVAPTLELAKAIRTYMELLLRWNRKVSLTSITEPREILQRHFGESMFAAHAIPIERGRLVDVGSGAGFPGLALKMISPSLEVTLIEPNVKKAAFLAEVVRALSLSSVRIMNERTDDILSLEANADFVTCRAVRSDKQLLGWMRKALTTGGCCVFWVGMEGATALQQNAEWNWVTPISVPLSSGRVLLAGKPSTH
ncbi:MAG: 16S rRNA (guanine(527)-N(7))-methyltransferase RsmG [Acidobacteria bacterium]|nr:16S rRNA (guanine(527)-N(7))-methyltransferase RsmG [Acidobacteriota bacterium]